MDNQLIQNLKSSIDSGRQLAVAVGQNPSLDQMAAALSVYLTLKEAGRNVAIVAASEPIVEISSLVGIDKVKTEYSSETGDLIVSFPYSDGEIDKVSMSMDEDNNRLNIIVKAGEKGINFQESDVKYLRSGGSIDLLFVIGVQSMHDLQKVFLPEALEGTQIVNVDNSERNEGFGNMVLVSPKFSSLSEQVADLLLTLGYELDVDTAQNLLSGITQATRNFQNSNTTYLAFEIASILLKKGAVRTSPRQEQTGFDSSRQQQFGRSQSQPIQERQNRSQQARPQNRPNRSPQFTERNQPQANQNERQNRSQQARPQNRPLPKTNEASANAPMAFTPVQEMPREIKSEAMTEQSQNLPSQNETVKPPADWLTPKVYKGSSDL